MRRFGWLGFAVIAIAALLWLAGDHLTARATDDATEHGFVGAKKCKACHKKEKKGAQYPKWLESDHAKAYETLLTEESKKICVDMGIETAPEETDQCLKCHVTGHGAKDELLGKKYDKTEGVTCESCHGAAADWFKPHKEEAALADAKAAGLIEPSCEKMCLECHNEESPTYKPFVHKEKLAAIAHPNPSKGAEEAEEK